jgi:transcriptional regulator with XRE-family HTH domain
MAPRSHAVEKSGRGEDLLRAAYGDTLRKWRTLQGNLNQTELSRKAGLPDYVVGSLERRQRPLDMEELAKICHALGLGLDRFLEEAHLALLHAVQPLAESLRGGEGKAVLEGHPSREELRRAADLVFERGKQLFLSLAQTDNRSLPPAEAERQPRSRPKRPKARR